MAKSKFFANSYTPTAEIKALRASAVNEDLVITVPKSNYLGNVTCIKTEYAEIINFLSNHFILPALTLSPGEMNPEWLSEFWFTCTHSVVQGISQIQGFIDNGTQQIIITASTIRKVLQLPVHDVYEPLPDGDVAKGGLVNLTKIECKFSDDGSGNRRYSTVLKSKMDGVWNALFSNFIQSLGTKTGSYDQFNSLEAQISWSLVNSLKVDYASVIFNDLVNRVAESTRAKYVPYPRFLSLIFKNQFEAYDRVSFQGFEPTLVGSQIFSKPATVSLPEFMKHKGTLAPQPITMVHPSSTAPPATTSLTTPPVTTIGQPPLKNTSTAPKKKSKLRSLTLTDQGHSKKKKTSKDAKGEAEAERSVAAGTLAKPQPISASLDSRKSSDSTKGQLQTAAMDQPIVSSDSGTSHTPLSSQPISHLPSSQKDDTLDKGLVTSVGDNTLNADVTPLATDPRQSSSITAPTVNVFPQSQGQIQVETSVSNDPSATTPADDVEGAKPIITTEPPATLVQTPADNEDVQPMDTSASEDEALPPPPFDTTASPATPVTSPIKELDVISLFSDNDNIIADTEPPITSAQSQPQHTPPNSPHTDQKQPTPHPSPQRSTSTDKLLMEYIASSQSHIKLLTEERDALKGNVSDLTDKVHSLAAAYESIPPWSEHIKEQVKELVKAQFHQETCLETQSTALSELAAYTKLNLSSHSDDLKSLTNKQKEMASSITEYIQHADEIIKHIPTIVSQQQELKEQQLELKDDIAALLGDFSEYIKGENKEEHEDDVVREDDGYEMETESDDENVFHPIDFPEFHPDELRMYDLKVKVWAADEGARIEGETVSFELARWEWMIMNRNDDDVEMGDDNDNDDGGDDNDGNNGGDANGNQKEDDQDDDQDENAGDKKEDDDDKNDDADDKDKDADDDMNDDADKTDEKMEDESYLASLRSKRKRNNESDSDDFTSSKDSKRTFTEEDISATILELEIMLSEPETSSQNKEPESNFISDLDEETVTSSVFTATQSTLPLQAANHPTTATTVTTTFFTSSSTDTLPSEVAMTETSTPALLLSLIPETSAPTGPLSLISETSAPASFPSSMPETSAPNLLLSSDFDSGSPLHEENDEQRLERKVKARQEMEREMILKIQAEAEAKEEEERKRRLKEQSDADRVFLLNLSGEEAEERERSLKLKRDQEEGDAVFARVLQKLEEAEQQRESAVVNIKKKEGAKSSVDRLWSEIDRKRYAARMIGRSNPAPITKVNLKKPKNKSQAQLLIHRGMEVQAITLDQVCKLHREEWNEIRLAVSHSSSSAKKEVLEEIDRLFKKMVELQLLRPEDTVILGEEIERPPSPRYHSGTRTIYRIPNTSRLNLQIPDGVPRVEGTEVTEGDKGLVYRDLTGALRFQREDELEKIDHEQLIHLIRSVSMLNKDSLMRKAITEEALARQFRYLPSTEKYELADELGVVKDEEVWRNV